MAKTGYRIDYVVRGIKDDLSDLEAIHQEVFPKNQLAIWRTKDGVIVKVSNFNKVSGTRLSDAKKSIGYSEKVI